MRFRVALVVVTLSVAAPLIASEQRAATENDHAHHRMAPIGMADENLAIEVTINPEARVSVQRIGRSPPPVPCGTPVVLPVRIVNKGFVTAPVEVRLSGHVAPGVALDFPTQDLLGSPAEERTLRITLTRPGPTDVSIAFKLPNDAPDLGGRGTIHVLMSCT